MPETRAHAALTLEASSARVAMRAGPPPVGAYAQFAYSAVERANAAAAAGAAPAGRPQFRPRRERDRSPRAALELRGGGSVSLPRHAMRYERAGPRTPYECHAPVWPALRRTPHFSPPGLGSGLPPAHVHSHPLHHPHHGPTSPVHAPVRSRMHGHGRHEAAHHHAHAHPGHVHPAHPHAGHPGHPGHGHPHAGSDPFVRGMHFARDIFSPTSQTGFGALHDGRDPHRQKVKFVDPSHANQATYLSVCPAGVLSVSISEGARAHRPGDVVAGSVFLTYASRADARVVNPPAVWVCCEVARRQTNPHFCGGVPTAAEDISDLLVPHGSRPFVYHHTTGSRRGEHSRPVGLAHAPYNHCSELIRGDAGAPLRVPTVTDARRVSDGVDAFDFDFVLPDDLPHSYSWADATNGPGAFLDIRYRIMAALELETPPPAVASPSAESMHGAPPVRYSHVPSTSAGYLPTSLPFVVASSPSSDSSGASNRATLAHSPAASPGYRPMSLPAPAMPADLAGANRSSINGGRGRYMVVSEAFLLVASAISPSPSTYLPRADARLRADAPRKRSCRFAGGQQELRVEVLDSLGRLDRPLAVRVTVFAGRDVTSVTARCTLEEAVFFGASPTKRARATLSPVTMRAASPGGTASFLFALDPENANLYPSAVVGPLAVRHMVVAYVAEYTVGYADGSGSETFCARGRPRLAVEVPVALEAAVAPADPNPLAVALAAPVHLSPPPAAGAPGLRALESGFERLFLRRDVHSAGTGICVRRRSAPAIGRVRAPLLRFGVKEKGDEDDTCPICMGEVEEGAEVGRLSCGHLGCKECMVEMVAFSAKNRKDMLCPICRRRAEPVE